MRGLLLAVSTLAFAIAAQVYLFNRPFFTGGFSTVQIPRVDIGPFELTHRNRAYYYFVLVILVVVLLLVGHLKRTGIGRMIVGVRENELAAAAMTVSPARAKLIAFAVGGFIAGLGGVLLGAVNLTFGPSERFFLVEDSIRLISIAVIGGLGSLSGAVIGARLGRRPAGLLAPERARAAVHVEHRPAAHPALHSRAASCRSATTCATRCCAGSRSGWDRSSSRRPSPRRLPRSAVPRLLEPAVCNADGSVLATSHLTVRFGGLVAVDDVDFHADPGEVIGLIGNNGAGKSTLLNAIGGFVPARGSVTLLGRM